MKKYIFFAGVFVYILANLTYGHNVKQKDFERLRLLNEKAVLQLYTKEINPEYFEEFVSLVGRSKKIEKYKKRIVRLIFYNAVRFDLDPLTLLALFAHESKFAWWKKGDLDELGMGQVRPSVWFNKRNQHNLHKAGIVSRRKPYQLKYIGKGIHSTAHILNVYRNLCKKWERQKRLRRRGYRSVNECMIRRYNGSRNTHKYYVSVSSYVGRFYYFIKNKRIAENNLLK